MAEIDTSNDWNGNKHASFVTNGDSNHSERERERKVLQFVMPGLSGKKETKKNQSLIGYRRFI